MILASEHVAKQIIVAGSLYIILEAILSIMYHNLNTRTRIAHLGRISRIIAGVVIIILEVIV